MFISQNDKRLYAFCEDLLKSKYLEPTLHEEFSRLLNDSTIKNFYYMDKELQKSYQTLNN
jgi:hypothetical protein